MEAYGVVGFYVTVQSLVALLDLGLSTTLNRELARLAEDDDPAEARRLASMLQLLYWSVAAIIALVGILAAPPLAHFWFHRQALPVATLVRALRVMAVIVAVQFPFALYAGGLLGLQRHVSYNAALIAAATLRGVGAVAALALLAPTIDVFFGAQLVGHAVQTLLAAILFFRALPAGGRSAATVPARRVWRFAAGVSGITILGALLSQVDKVVLSKVLPLREFGFYAVATSAAAALSLIGAPFFATVFPRLSQLVAAHDERSLVDVYHRSAQLLAVAVLPPAVVLIAFPRQVLAAWTGDAALADSGRVIIVLLAAGFALNALTAIPYALQLAHGWTSLTLAMNAAAVAVLVPLSIWAAVRYGAPGAALIWMLLNITYVGLYVQLMHRRLLRGEKWSWYARDVGTPLVASCLVVLPGLLVMRTVTTRASTAAALAALGLLALAAAAWLTPTSRQLLRGLGSRT